MGWSKDPGPTDMAGRLPAFFISGGKMSDLSIFVDESGDLGGYSQHSPYYIVSMVFHDRSHDISSAIRNLDIELAAMGLAGHTVHTEPLIRKEGDYARMKPEDRRKIFSRLYYFAMKCEITFVSFVFEKKQFNTSAELEDRITRDISLFLDEHLEYFQSFDRIVLYYDNGQPALSRLLHAALSAKLSAYETRRAMPSRYKLFQVADLICTVELVWKKSQSGKFTRSEELIFRSVRDLKKDFWSRLDKNKRL